MDPQRILSGAQGTIGIVTWMSLKCRFLSELSRAFFVASPELAPLIELSYRLTYIRFSGNIFVLNNVNLAALMRTGPGEIHRLAGNLPQWVMFVSCEGYGPLYQEKVEYLETDLRELAASYKLEVRESVAGVRAVDFASLLMKPSPEPYWKFRSKGAFQELFFLTTQGKTPDFAGLMSEIAASRAYPALDIGAYIQPVAQGTGCHCEFDFYYNPEDPRENRQTREILADAADKLEAAGAFFSRPYQAWADTAYRRSADTAAMQKKVKGIFDPNGILNPGKLCFK